MKTRLFVDFDGTAAEWRFAAAFEDLYKKGYFETLKPQNGVLDALFYLKKTRPNLEIIGATCYLIDSKYALEEKMRWAEKYLPGIKVLFIPNEMNKAEAIRQMTGQPVSESDYLLDDYSKNLKEFKEAGGIGIKLMNGFNGNNGTWTGLRVHKDDCVEALSSIIR